MVTLIHSNCGLSVRERKNVVGSCQESSASIEKVKKKRFLVMEDSGRSSIVITKFHTVCWTNFCCEFRVVKIKPWKVFVASSEKVVHFVEKSVWVWESRNVHLLKNLYLSEHQLFILLKTYSFELENCVLISHRKVINLWNRIEWALISMTRRLIFVYLSYLITNKIGTQLGLLKCILI